MSKRIGGALDLQAQARLAFTTIATACGWSREMVMRALGKEIAPG